MPAVAAVVVAAVCVAVVLVVTRGSPAPPVRGVAQARSLFAGIPQNGNVLGSAGAPVTMIDYVDPQCMPCRAFETQVLPRIVARFVRAGKVRIETRPVALVGRQSFAGISAALGAAEQNRMYEFLDVLLQNQGAENSGWLSDALLRRIADTIPGLDANRVLAAAAEPRVKDAETQFAYAASRDGVAQVPAVLVGRTGTRAVPVSLASPTDEASLVTAVERALR